MPPRITFYSKIATCVLESVDATDYTPGGVKSFQDGSPTQIHYESKIQRNRNA